MQPAKCPFAIIILSFFTTVLLLLQLPHIVRSDDGGDTGDTGDTGDIGDTCKSFESFGSLSETDSKTLESMSNTDWDSLNSESLDSESFKSFTDTFQSDSDSLNDLSGGGDGPNVDSALPSVGIDSGSAWNLNGAVMGDGIPLNDVGVVGCFQQ